MANTGRFIDRSPLIHAAGKSTGVPEQTVSSSIKDNAEDDAIDTLEQEAEIGTEDVSSETNSQRQQELMENREELMENREELMENREELMENREELMDNREELWDDQVGHQYHRKTHNDYNPSEQLEKGYHKRDRHFEASSEKDPREPEQEARHVHQKDAHHIHQEARHVHQEARHVHQEARHVHQEEARHVHQEGARHERK